VTNQISPAFHSQDEGILDSAQLNELERCFRAWAELVAAKKTKHSRHRILCIFLLIRYTGAKLQEVLSLKPSDVNLPEGSITYNSGHNARQAVISRNLSEELEGILGKTGGPAEIHFAIDPAYVRKKFYERAEQCGFEKKSGGPEMLRKARTIEMLHNVPLPAVQHLLGHSSPHLTTSFVAFSENDIREIARRYMERESGRRTSARNSFHGKVIALHNNEIQTLVELLTPGGHKIYSLITNTSADRLGVSLGKLLTAEVKSPWLILEQSKGSGTSSAENQLEGVVAGVSKGGINVECTVLLPDGTELCSVLTAQGFNKLRVSIGHTVRILFGANAVILHAD